MKYAFLIFMLVATVHADVVNGTFAGTGSSVYNATDIPGWTTLAPIDWISYTDNWPGPDASAVNSVDLDGSPGPGAITQTISTTAGQYYTLSFWLNVNPNYDYLPNPKVLTVTAGSTSSQFSKSLPTYPQGVNGPVFPNNVYNTPGVLAPYVANWSQETLGFTATGSTTAITFTSDSPSPLPGSVFTYPYNGAVITDVSVSVPEPGFFVVFGAFALVLTGFMAVFNRRNGDQQV
jgi:hypothetical protein